MGSRIQIWHLMFSIVLSISLISVTSAISELLQPMYPPGVLSALLGVTKTCDTAATSVVLATTLTSVTSSMTEHNSTARYENEKIDEKGQRNLEPTRRYPDLRLRHG